MIEVEHVSKVYQRQGTPVTALLNVTLAIAEGDFVSITGPSGSGKSTFLLTVGGLVHPTSGSVRLDSLSLYDLTPTQRARLRLHTIGFLGQTFHLIPYLTALENVMVPLCLDGCPSRKQRLQAVHRLEEVGLGDRLHHKPGELSVGERQRVALARTLVNHPAILLADEPTGNLDPPRAREIIQHFQRLHAQGLTIILVTHNESAAACAPRRLRLVGGEVRSEEGVIR